jgi:methylated-DNA-[protein]-cysteine S-methyltransferase
MPELITTFRMDSPLGEVFGAISPRGLLVLSVPEHDEAHFWRTLQKRAQGAETRELPPEKTLAGRELAAYFRKELKEFSTPVDLEGLSRFSQKVLAELIKIPYGRTDTYGGIAKKAGNPAASRAVGRCVGANPVPVVVPCHRVIGADGSLTGFGCGLDTKRFLLGLEGIRIGLFD